ncbi:fasciclin domain-containing protein [soil metagenome]|jgi:uncharacterized surface protein with fasciclin (FAS1) repeats
MKKLILVPLFLLSSLCLFAQKTVLPSLLLDTIKAKAGKIKFVNGTPMLSSNDIIQNVSKSKEYSLLITAITDAGLTETFKSKGPITVFAPTNLAFENMPAGKLDTLLKPAHKLDLSYLLTYHALAGRVTAKDIARKINSGKGQATFTTIAGSKINARIDANRNIILIDENGGQSVISQFDIPQSNGMLHVVNAVLMPKAKVI